MVKNKTVLPTNPLQAELADKVSQAQKEAKNAILRASLIEKGLQSIIDEANILTPLIPYVKPQDAEGLIDIWSSVVDQVSKIDIGLGAVHSSSDSADSTASISSAIISRAYTDNRLLTEDSDFHFAWTSYIEFTSRQNQKNEVVALLREFSLDITHKLGEKSALELFETAHEAFEKPLTQDSPVSTSLIPLRGSIESAIQKLILMRPQQEETGGWKKKIISIGRQLKKDSLPNEVIDEWAEECHSLINHLSGSKTGNIDRENWLILLNRGTNFLSSLLKGLDSKKLTKSNSY